MNAGSPGRLGGMYGQSPQSQPTQSYNQFMGSLGGGYGGGMMGRPYSPYGGGGYSPYAMGGYGMRAGYGSPYGMMGGQQGMAGGSPLPDQTAQTQNTPAANTYSSIGLGSIPYNPMDNMGGPMGIAPSMAMGMGQAGLPPGQMTPMGQDIQSRLAPSILNQGVQSTDPNRTFNNNPGNAVPFSQGLNSLFSLFRR